MTEPPCVPRIFALLGEKVTFHESTARRWLAMQVGGDVDIVLGAVRQGPGREAYIPPEFSCKWRESGATLMLLENLGR